MLKDDFLAIYTQLVKQNKNPIVNVDASQGEVIVPRNCVDESGCIQLHIGPRAVRYFKILSDRVYCQASFNKQVFCLSFPVENVMEIFAS